MNKGETREQLREKRERIHREALHLEWPKTLRIDPAAYTLVGCQEASILSRQRYLACNKPAKAVVANKDSCIYFMCAECAYHNVNNRGGVLIANVEPGFIG